jgi:ABC-2 type transport system permease protein
MRAIFDLDLRRSRSLLLWGSAVSAGYASVMALIYPTVHANAARIDDYIKIFPKEMMAAFGVHGSLADPGIFFNTYIATFLWPLVAAIIGIVLATRPIGADLDRGFLELVVSSPLPRRRYLAVSILGQLLVTTVVAAATIAGVLIVGALVGAGFPADRFLLAIPFMASFAWAIAGFATLLSVVTLSRGTAGGITVGVLLAMYLANLISAIEPKLAWLADVSVFGHFNAERLIADGAIPWGEIGVFVAIAGGCWLLAVALFGWRDLAA